MSNSPKRLFEQEVPIGALSSILEIEKLTFGELFFCKYDLFLTYGQYKFWFMFGSN